MIIVRLRGGVGNQLFQYAAAKALALERGVALKADLYTYKKHPYRKYELNNFNIDLSEATREEVHEFTGNNFLVRYLNKRENYFHCPRVFAQPHYHFYEDFFDLPAPLYVSGYWQSEKYFITIADQLRKSISPRNGWDSINAELIEAMKKEESVTIHIRRSDYIKKTQNSPLSFFSPLDIDYYKKAIATIQEKISAPRFYFFSDDINWCRHNFSEFKNAVFVSHNTGANSFKDLLLMSNTKHQIIANSTFSWWAAWLNQNSDKIVIAPQNWFHLNYLTKYEPVYPCRFYNTKDLIPQEWVTIE